MTGETDVEKLPASRLHLQAGSLEFPHANAPTQEQVKCPAPLPEVRGGWPTGGKV